MQRGKIHIIDLEVPCHIGVSESERKSAQKLFFTLEMTYDFSKSIVSDSIEDALDYKTVANEILIFIKKSNYKLLESLSSALGEHLLRNFRDLNEVKVFITKKIANLTVRVECEKKRVS